jgi:hypothetical protein
MGAHGPTGYSTSIIGRAGLVIGTRERLSRRRRAVRKARPCLLSRVASTREWSPPRGLRWCGIYPRGFWQHRSTAHAAIPADIDLVSLARSPCFAPLLRIGVPRGAESATALRQGTSGGSVLCGGPRWQRPTPKNPYLQVDAPSGAQNKADIHPPSAPRWLR